MDVVTYALIIFALMVGFLGAGLWIFLGLLAISVVYPSARRVTPRLRALLEELSAQGR